MFPLLALLLLGGLTAGYGGLVADDGHCDGTLCFAVFSKPADFQTARDQCSEFAGHLMTVRTADSNAVLRGLLKHGSGPHWVGLARAAGCPDETGALRGFHWDTGDTGSDFSNWDAAAADRSGCARRCVSVSSGEGFRWSVGPCDARAAGFLCEYLRSDACEPPGALGSYARPPYAGRSGGAEPRPHGTIFTRDSDGATSMCLSGEWVPAPWPCGMRGGGCEFECGGTEDRPVCLCPPGRSLSGEDAAVCAPVRGDPCRVLGCAHGCGGSPPACACRPGFLLGADGRSCREAGPPPRGLRACGRGYHPTVADDCADVDECQNAPCEHHCTNTRGSFTCSCFEGYRLDPEDPLRCLAYCGHAECPAECDPNDPEDCQCPSGYILDVRMAGGVCMDLDECENYHCEQLCTNSYGSYTCGCHAGYSLVEDYRCVLGTVTESTTLSYVPTSDPAPPRSARLSAGGLVAVVVAVAVMGFLVVILVYHFATRRSEGRAASPGGAGEHNLEQVASVLIEKAPAQEE